jgi:hypothetical protein
MEKGYRIYLGAGLWESATIRPVQRTGRLHFLFNTPKSYLSQENNGEGFFHIISSYQLPIERLSQVAQFEKQAFRKLSLFSRNSVDQNSDLKGHLQILNPR